MGVNTWEVGGRDFPRFYNESTFQSGDF